MARALSETEMNSRHLTSSLVVIEISSRSIFIPNLIGNVNVRIIFMRFSLLDLNIISPITMIGALKISDYIGDTRWRVSRTIRRFILDFFFYL